MLASTDALAQICIEKPITLEALRKMGILPPTTIEYCGDMIVLTVRKHMEDKGESISEPCDCEMNPDMKLFGLLMKLNHEISNRIFTPVNRIISQSTLKKLCELKPVTRFQLMEKTHIGNSKCLVFGRIFIQAVREYTGDQSQPDGFEGAPKADSELFVKLADLRHRFAVRENKTDLSVMSDYTLYDICIKRPQNDEDFRAIYGIGEFKSQKYAAAFIAAVREYKDQ